MRNNSARQAKFKNSGKMFDKRLKFSFGELRNFILAKVVAEPSLFRHIYYNFMCETNRSFLAKIMLFVKTTICVSLDTT